MPSCSESGAMRVDKGKNRGEGGVVVDKVGKVSHCLITFVGRDGEVHGRGGWRRIDCINGCCPSQGEKVSWCCVSGLQDSTEGGEYSGRCSVTQSVFCASVLAITTILSPGPFEGCTTGASCLNLVFNEAQM